MASRIEQIFEWNYFRDELLRMEWQDTIIQILYIRRFMQSFTGELQLYAPLELTSYIFPYLNSKNKNKSKISDRWDELVTAGQIKQHKIRFSLIIYQNMRHRIKQINNTRSKIPHKYKKSYNYFSGRVEKIDRFITLENHDKFIQILFIKRFVEKFIINSPLAASLELTHNIFSFIDNPHMPIEDDQSTIICVNSWNILRISNGWMSDLKYSY